MRATVIIGSVCTAAAALWALTPPSSETECSEITPASEHSPTETDSSSPDALTEPLDETAFALRLWNPPPSQESDPSEQQGQETTVNAQTPLQLQLIGIIEEEGRPRAAALYDPETDRLFIVADGEQVNRYTVVAVTARQVTLTDGRATHTLDLKERSSQHTAQEETPLHGVSIAPASLLPGAGRGLES